MLHKRCWKNVHHLANIPKQLVVKENNITIKSKWGKAFKSVPKQHYKCLNSFMKNAKGFQNFPNIMWQCGIYHSIYVTKFHIFTKSFDGSNYWKTISGNKAEIKIEKGPRLLLGTGPKCTVLLAQPNLGFSHLATGGRGSWEASGRHGHSLAACRPSAGSSGA